VRGTRRSVTVRVARWRITDRNRTGQLPGRKGGFASRFCAPPAGFEPAHTAPEAVALSPELWGLRPDPQARACWAGARVPVSNIGGHGADPRASVRRRRYPRAGDTRTGPSDGCR